MMQRSWGKAMAGNTQLQRGGFTKTHKCFGCEGETNDWTYQM